MEDGLVTLGILCLIGLFMVPVGWRVEQRINQIVKEEMRNGK